mgnify:CR=1 FL=1
MPPRGTTLLVQPRLFQKVCGQDLPECEMKTRLKMQSWKVRKDAPQPTLTTARRVARKETSRCRRPVRRTTPKAFAAPLCRDQQLVIAQACWGGLCQESYFQMTQHSHHNCLSHTHTHSNKHSSSRNNVTGWHTEAMPWGVVQAPQQRQEEPTHHVLAATRKVLQWRWLAQELEQLSHLMWEPPRLVQRLPRAQLHPHCQHQQQLPSCCRPRRRSLSRQTRHCQSPTRRTPRRPSHRLRRRRWPQWTRRPLFELVGCTLSCSPHTTWRLQSWLATLDSDRTTATAHQPTQKHRSMWTTQQRVTTAVTAPGLM